MGWIWDEYGQSMVNHHFPTLKWLWTCNQNGDGMGRFQLFMMQQKGWWDHWLPIFWPNSKLTPCWPHLVFHVKNHVISIWFFHKFPGPKIWRPDHAARWPPRWLTALESPWRIRVSCCTTTSPPPSNTSQEKVGRNLGEFSRKNPCFKYEELPTLMWYHPPQKNRRMTMT